MADCSNINNNNLGSNNATLKENLIPYSEELSGLCFINNKNKIIVSSYPTDSECKKCVDFDSSSDHTNLTNHSNCETCEVSKFINLQTHSSIEVECSLIGNNDNGMLSSKSNHENNAKQYPVAFEIDVSNSTDSSTDVTRKTKHNLQKAFLNFRKKKQDEIQQAKHREEAKTEINRSPARLEELREKIIVQAKKYFGVPYARKYWAHDVPEHSSPLFLDCCGLVRQVLHDLQQDVGFRLGPWNQAYMFDTLPITLTKEQMKRGDLVFMSGIYVHPKSKKQLHDMVHVEIWLGEGDKTIGSRWNNGKVQIFESYKFSPKSFHSEQYIFKSIDTWLNGICYSHCPVHSWLVKKHITSSKSIFNIKNSVPYQKADFDNNDDNDDSENGEGQNYLNGKWLETNRRIQSSLTITNDEDKHQDFSVSPASASLKSQAKFQDSFCPKLNKHHLQRLNRYNFIQIVGYTPNNITKQICSETRDAEKINDQLKVDRLLLNKQSIATNVKSCPDLVVTEMTGKRQSLTKCGTCPNFEKDLILDGKKIRKYSSRSAFTINVQMWNKHTLEHVYTQPPVLIEVSISKWKTSQRTNTKSPHKKYSCLMSSEKTSFYRYFQHLLPVERVLFRIKSWQVLENNFAKIVEFRRRYNIKLLAAGDHGMSSSWECIDNHHVNDSCGKEVKSFSSLVFYIKCCDDNNNGIPNSQGCFIHKSLREYYSAVDSYSSLKVRQGKTWMGRSFHVNSKTSHQDSMRSSQETSAHEISSSVDSSLVFATEISDPTFLRCTLSEEDDTTHSYINVCSQLPKRCNKLEAVERKGVKRKCITTEFKTEPYLQIEDVRGKDFDKDVVLRHGQDISESKQIEVSRKDFFYDSQISLPLVDLSINEFSFFEEDTHSTGQAHGTETLPVSNEIQGAMWHGIDMLTEPTHDWGIFSKNAQILQFSKTTKGGVSSNINNNSSNIWCSDIAGFASTESEDAHTTSANEPQKTSRLLSLNIHKRVFRTNDTSKVRTPECKISAINSLPSLKDASKQQNCNLVSSSEETRLQTSGAFHNIDNQVRSSPRHAWNTRLSRPGDAQTSLDEVYGDMQDSKSRVACYVLNQWPSRFDETDRLASAFYRCPKSTGHILPVGSTNNFTAAVMEETTSLGGDDFDHSHDNCTTESRKIDICHNQPVTLRHSAREDGPRETRFTPICSLDNLNEMTMEITAAQCPVTSHRRRNYFVQDTTSNDGDGDIDFSQSDDDGDDDDDDDDGNNDAFEYFDRTIMMQKLVKIQEGENFHVFNKSLTTATKELSGSDGRLDLMNDRHSGGGGEQSQSTRKPCDQDGSNSERNGERVREGGDDNQIKGGGGDSNDDKDEDKGVHRKTSKLPHWCLPNSMQPTFFIGGANGIGLVEGPLLALGWKRTVEKFDDNYKLKWVENKNRINYLAFREGEQLVNHIPNCKLLTNKLGLLCSLQDYERMTLRTKGRLPKLKMADFVPETYKLDDKTDREKFIKEYRDGEIWICKPISMNQGKGIFLLRSREQINEHLFERDSKLHSKPVSRVPMLRIVQRYISKPLLLEGRKFDIRSYMFIASTVPFLVLYHKGYVRLSCHKYNHEDTNLTTHLTNQFIQKKDPSYKDVKEDTAWTMDKFNDYINHYVAKEMGLEDDWVYGTLTKQMQRITLHCFNSVKHRLQCKLGFFDLYGMDFMVDSNMKVWLIEINANPALHINCQALKETIPSIIEDGLYLAIECFEKSCKGQPLMPINSLGGYSVLYCGCSPNAVTQRQIRSISPFKDITPWNRPTGTFPSNRRLSPPHNLPRMQALQTSNYQVISASQVASSKVDKRAVYCSTLPIINIGVSLPAKTVSAAGHASYHIQKQDHLSIQSQQQSLKHPQQSVKRISVTTLSEDEQKFCIKYSVSDVEKSKDKLHRGN